VPVPPTLPSVAAIDALETAETVEDEVAAVSETETVTVTAAPDTVAVRPDRVARAEPMESDAPPPAPEAQAAEMPPPDEATPVEDAVRAEVAEDTVVAAVEEVAPPPAEKPKPPKAKPSKAAPAKSAPAPPPVAAVTAKAKGAGAGKVGAGGTSDSQGRASASSYRAKVTAHLQRRRFYPNEAKRGRLGGTAVVRFTLNARGGVVSATIARSTGHAVLDRAAIAMVKRASPFPPIPAGLGASITIEAPIRFEPPR
jgi:protein TonB